MDYSDFFYSFSLRKKKLKTIRTACNCVVFKVIISLRMSQGNAVQVHAFVSWTLRSHFVVNSVLQALQKYAPSV